MKLPKAKSKSLKTQRKKSKPGSLKKMNESKIGKPETTFPQVRDLG